MRLLYVDENGGLALTQNFTDEHAPEYAILSHTWCGDEGEVSFHEIITGRGDDAMIKAGYTKLKLIAQMALQDGHKYLWADTCCISRDSSAELQEAIVSMFSWYKNAFKCYAYLSDVSVGEVRSNEAVHRRSWEAAFRASRWFTRAWTLPELLAPARLEFVSSEGVVLGDKIGLRSLISEITGIPNSALEGTSLDEFGIEERMSWAKGRQARRREDKAYSLLGMFDVFMPLLYGEGDNAIERLHEEIHRAELRRRIQSQLVYHPLKTSEIRALVIYPGGDDADIWTRLDTVKLGDDARYQALSYVWGQEPALHSLRVGHDMRCIVRPNLFHALRRIRKHRRIKLWVDSICINQSDDQERNMQVQRMGEIFHRATNVWIWLGEEYEHSELAMGLITQLNHPDYTWDSSWWTQYEFVAFNNLLGRPWFRRGWVIQEAAFSKDTQILCGDRQVSWDQLVKAITLVQQRIKFASSTQTPSELVAGPRTQLINFYDSPAVKLLDIVSNVFRPEADGTISKQLTLETLVELGTHFETTDARDAIYALINLAKDTSYSLSPDYNLKSLVPDYRKRTIDVFADFVLHCCYASKSLDIICRPWAPVKGSDPHRQPTLDESILPSWIRTRDQLPFGDPAKRSSHRVHGNSLVENSRIRLYNAHFSTIPQVKIEKISGGNLSLVARGIAVGVVRRVSLRMAGAVIPKDCLKILRSVCRPNGEEAAMLCADILRRSNKSHSYDGKKISDWLIKQVPALIYDPWDEVPGLDIQEALESNGDPEMIEYLELVRQCVWNRRTFEGDPSDRSLGSIVGLLPQAARRHDTICILHGCSVPVVLRKLQDDGGAWYWRLIGEAYVHRFMDGEAKEGSFAQADFEIR